MCSINHSKKSIFIHIPKNGGSYIAEILSKHYGFTNYYLQRPDHLHFCGIKDKSVDKHENKIHGTLIYYKTSPYINNIMKMTKEKWNSYFIFTFIRNPYSRIVSGWNYCNKYNIPFENYLNIGFQSNSYDYWHTFMTQSRHLIDTNGKIRCNYIGYLENIENDIKIILNTIGFNNNQIIHKKSMKNSKKHKNYKDYYKNNDILNKVNEIYKEDFDNFKFIVKNDVLEL